MAHPLVRRLWSSERQSCSVPSLELGINYAGRFPSMMRAIVGASLKFRFLVLAMAAALMFFGLLRLGDMPVDVFPEFAPPRVEVQTEALGLSTTEVEAL